jgi:hypothetical protein
MFSESLSAFIFSPLAVRSKVRQLFPPVGGLQIEKTLYLLPHFAVNSELLYKGSLLKMFKMVKTWNLEVYPHPTPNLLVK